MSKFVVCNKHVKIKNYKSGDTFEMPAQYIGSIPSWCEKEEYYKLLVKDGTITFTESSDKELETAEKVSKAKEEKKEEVRKELKEKDEANAE